MATKGDIKQALYDECKTVLSSIETVTVEHGSDFESLSNVDGHVDIARERDGEQYPHIAFEEFSRPLNRGMGSHVYVDATTYVDGSLDSLTFRKDERVQFDCYVEATSDGRKDALYEALKSQFETYLELKEPADIHDDIEDMSVGETRSADRSADGVRGDRLRIVMDYARYETYTEIPTMETIQMDFDVGADGVDDTQHVVTN